MDVFAARPAPLGVMAHLYVPGYQPGRKKRSSSNRSPLCGSQCFSVVSGNVVPLAEALENWPNPDRPTELRGSLTWEWCKPCLGHAVSLAGLQRQALELVVRGGES